MSAVSAQLLRFSVIGAAGFCVDAAVLYLAMAYGEANPYVGRLVSYIFAASFTWALNRRYTFQAHCSESRTQEWARFLAGNAAGGILNYLTYALLVSSTAIVARYPVLGVAAGSVVGLFVNFSLSRRFVFAGQHPPRPQRLDKTILVMALLSVCVALTLIVNPWPRDRWYLTQYVLFGSFPGYDNYTPVSLPAWIYFSAHTIATSLGLDLAGEFYIAALIQDVMLFLSACFLYRAIKLMQMPRVAAPVAVGFLAIMLLIGLPHTFYSENAAVFLTCGLILALAMIIQRGSETGWKLWRPAILGGVFLGLLIATRMTPVLLVPLILLLFWRRMPARRITAVVSVMLVTASTLVAGMVLGNHARFGRYELSNSSGRHLWQGVKDFTDRALADSPEYQALKQQYPRVQGTYWDKLPPFREYNAIGPADPREPLLGRLAREAILNEPGVYLFHGAKKFVKTIGVAPSPDVFAGPGVAWNPLGRSEPLPPLLDLMHAPRAISGAGQAVLRSGYAAFSGIYPVSIFLVSLTGLAMIADQLERLLRGRTNRSRKVARAVPLSLLIALGIPLACVPIAVFGRTWGGYIGSGLCALALGVAVKILMQMLRRPRELGPVRDNQALFFVSALAFFGTLWFTWQVEYQAPRYALPYLPFWAIMLATSAMFWKQAWHALSASRSGELAGRSNLTGEAA